MNDKLFRKIKKASHKYAEYLSACDMVHLFIVNYQEMVMESLHV